MNKTLRSKLIFGFIISSAFSLVIGVIGTVIISKILHTNHDLATNYLPSVDYVLRASMSETEARSTARLMAHPDLDLQSAESALVMMDQELRLIDENLAKYKPMATTPKEKDLLELLETSLSLWKNSQEKAIALWPEKIDLLKAGTREKDPKAFMEFHDKLFKAQEESHDAYRTLDDEMGKLAELNSKIAAEIAVESQASGDRARLFMILTVILGVSCSIGMGLYIASTTLKTLGADPAEISEVVRQVTLGDTTIRLRDDAVGVYKDVSTMVQGLNEKANVAEQIAKGELTVEVRLASERDRLGKAFQTMINVLREIISRANSASYQVATGSSQVSSASQSLSQGATEQASSVEEISSSVTEISSKIKTNASNASAASDVAGQAQLAAEQGNRQIEVTLEAMNGINVSSQEISKIIKVIDDIAFQTNLLALNAAVEAARAGRHGKGFAVVADEVRNLAGRSAKAAKETTELIESSSRKVDAGLSEARKTAESFKEIVRNSMKVSDIISQIASASNEQANGISQIAGGVNQINKVTQQTTANAEETAAAAEELASQAEELKRSLAYFRLGNDRQSYESAPQQKVVPMRSQIARTDEWGRGPSPSHDNHRSENDKDNLSLDDQDFGKYGT